MLILTQMKIILIEFDTILIDLVVVVVAVDVAFVLALSCLNNWIWTDHSPGSKRFSFLWVGLKRSLDPCTPGYVEPCFYIQIYFKRADVILEHFLSSSTFKTSLCECQVFVYKTNINYFFKICLCNTWTYIFVAIVVVVIKVVFVLVIVLVSVAYLS